VTSRLQIDYDVLRVVNPRLVYCSITGYGSTGPERHRKAFDLTVQAATGMMSITGDPTGLPSKTGASLSDGIAGTFALAGILGALYQRHETGLGQFVDVSMADCLVSLIFDEPFECYRLVLAHRQGNRIARFSPRPFRRKLPLASCGEGARQDQPSLMPPSKIDAPMSAESSRRPTFCQTDQLAIVPCRRSLRRSNMDSIRSSLRSWTS
jgi:hypothetical protein